ncbi:MAG TPA: response regulator [Thiothrix sp.]|nr:response regulator [Thiothrix sp.]
MNNSDLDTLDNIPVGMTVMVIDDSKTIRRTAEILLSEQGCKVLLASDGFESLAIIASDRPDMVFVDIMMPRLDGYQTCALIKGHPEYRDIPVVMLSSKDSIFDMARGGLAGSESYITKPFTRNDLVAAIQKHVKPTDVKKEAESEQANDDMDFDLDDFEELEMTL